MNYTEHLLTCLIEEAAEVQKEACKALRFGLNAFGPDSQYSNAEAIAHEIAEMVAVAEMMQEMGLINLSEEDELIEEKKRRVEKYMKHSEERGLTVKADAAR